MKTNTSSNDYIARLIAPFASVSMLVMAIIFQPWLALGSITYWILGGLSVATTVDYIASKVRNKMDRYFEAIGKAVDVTQSKTENGIEYRCKLPAGMSTEDIGRQQLAIEQYLNAGIAVSYDNGYAIINASEKRLKAMYEYELIQTDNPLEVCIGYSLDGRLTLDLESCPHLLIAGATGAGKSVLLRSIITSLILMKKAELHLVDFQRVELGIFKKSSKVKSFCSEPLEFARLLAEIKAESDKRLALFDKANVVNIGTYNKKNKPLPYIVVIVDEFATLGERQYNGIMDALKVRIAQDRKCGIHYIICTQRPSVDIIGGTIKANIPARIALKVSSDTDSRVILDETGAADLRGAGHGILKITGKKEFQAMYLSETEAYRMVEPTFVQKEERKHAQPNHARPPVNKVY